MTLSPGTRLGPYQILSPIGAGGMGEAYRARDERLGRDVAIKVLPADLYVASGDLRFRFDRLDLATGRRTRVRDITPADPTGVSSLADFRLTPDGKSYCYSFMRALSRLYVVDGLR